MAKETLYVANFTFGENKTYQIQDTSAIHKINGYTVTDIEKNTVQFANQPISTAQILSLFNE